MCSLAVFSVGVLWTDRLVGSPLLSSLVFLASLCFALLCFLQGPSFIHLLTVVADRLSSSPLRALSYRSTPLFSSGPNPLSVQISAGNHQSTNKPRLRTHLSVISSHPYTTPLLFLFPYVPKCQRHLLLAGPPHTTLSCAGWRLTARTRRRYLFCWRRSFRRWWGRWGPSGWRGGWGGREREVF